MYFSRTFYFRRKPVRFGFCFCFFVFLSLFCCSPVFLCCCVLFFPRLSAVFLFFCFLLLCQWKREVQKVFFQINCFQRTSEKFLVPPLCVCVCVFFFSNGCKRHKSCFLLQIVEHAERNQLVRRLTPDLNIDLAHGQPARCPAWPTNIDDGPEDIRWIYGLGGESLPAAFDGILTNLKKTCFAIRDGWRIVVLCFVHTSGQLFLYHAPGQLPPHDTGHGAQTVTLGWVGAPNERTPVRFMTQSLILSIDVLSRTRNLAALNQTSA